MDHIAQQLRAEIQSLEDHIKRSGNRLLATQWVDELIGPFDQIEDTLDTEDLRSVVIAFHHARNHFKVNGHLADRIDEILARHGTLIAHLGTRVMDDGSSEYGGVVLPADSDPGDTTATDDAGSLFFDEDEEFAEGGESHDAAGRPIDFGRDEVQPDAVAGFTGRTDVDEDPVVHIDFGRDEVQPDAVIDFGRDDDTANEPASTVDFGRDEVPPDAVIDFGRDDDTANEPASTVDFGRDADGPDRAVDFGVDSPAVSASLPDDGGSDELFATAAPSKRTNPAPATSTAAKGGSVDDKTRDSSLSGKAARTTQSVYSIFDHVVSVDDLAAGLDIDIPAQDRTFLEQKLRARLDDRVVAALRASKSAEKQYILMPRITRADAASGGTLPLTVKNMAKRYIGIFGDIRDLMRYRNDSMMSIEVPEPGWAIISAEAPRESLGKNYMEQNQYLRYLATSLAIPSHLVRRRTMVESIYDMIVGELVMGEHLQRASLDWTASTPAKNDYVCVYFPEEGIRVRDLSRVTHHRSLGVTPNW
ncbi:MAG: hypothetical protein O2782_03465 [bacterium]|nr:hypothetical protein [bacterium]